MKQTLGRQVVSTLPVKHILLLQQLHEPPSPVSTARPMWLTSGRISHEAVYAGRRVALAKTAATDHAIRKCAFSPIAGERVGVEGWGGMGTYWRPTVPNPHASPKVRCAVSEI